MSIPPEKIEAILQELRVWLGEVTIQLKELQKLLGRVFHATKCCIGARLFCNRLLDGLRAAYRSGYTPITQEMKMDVFWLVAFLQQFNGVHFIRQPTIQQTLYVDSCLTAGGAAWGTAMFTALYPPSLVACQWHISQLEAFTLLLALRFWQSQLARQNIWIFCDNAATVAVMQSGRSVDPFLRACAREVWLLATLNDISLTTTHIAGVLNQTADTLSRAHLSHSAVLETRMQSKAVPLPDKFMGPPTFI